MPVTRSAKKALQKDQRRTIVNLRIRQDLKKILKKTWKNPTQKRLSQAASLLDRAAKKRVIHPNKASRLKSRLAKASSQKKTTT